MDVIKMAHEEGLLQNGKALAALQKGDEALSSWISCHMYKPVYTNLIHLPVGKHFPSLEHFPIHPLPLY